MPSLDELIQQLSNSDQPRAHEALQALREHIWQCGADRSRRAKTAAALAAQLNAVHSPLVIRHLCELLSLVAGDAELPALKVLLKSATHGRMACFALTRMRSAASTAALAEALSEIGSTETRIAIINALGRASDSRFKKRLADLLRDRNLEIRLAAAGALSHYPDAALYPLLVHCDTGGDEWARRYITDASLRLAESLLRDNQRAAAKSIYEDIARHKDNTPAVRAAGLALSGLG